MPTIDIKGGTVTYEDFDYFGERRRRVTRIKAKLVRRRTTVDRSKHCALCLYDEDGTRDLRYPQHTEGGHLIGLSLGGVDCDHNLVPMYAGFNRVTWKAIETQIYKDGTIKEMQVSISYTEAEPRRPRRFHILVQYGESAVWKQYKTLDMMDEPQAYNFDISESARQRIAAAQEEMTRKKWTAEKGGMKKKFLPDTDPDSRRYAVLDYLVLVKPESFKNLVRELGLADKYFPISPGGDFTLLQRELILRLNYINHKNSLRSDLGRALLLQGSTTLAPQIDHILAKSTNAGYNAFSNAMVLSAMENVSKGAKRALTRGGDEEEDSGSDGRKRARTATSGAAAVAVAPPPPPAAAAAAAVATPYYPPHLPPPPPLPPPPATAAVAAPGPRTRAAAARAAARASIDPD